MIDIIAAVLATIITIPIIGWYVAYIIHVKITKKKKRAIRFASDMSTILFIVAVYFIMYEIWQRSFLSVILIVIFSVALIFTLLHYKSAKDIHIPRLLKGIWRMNFLFFFGSYLVLLFFGLIVRVFTYI